MKVAFNTFDPRHCARRWVCYLDILGFSELVESGDIVSAVHTYFRSRELVEWWARRNPAMGLACFSDSYILYADNDSAGRFARIEQAARWIVNEHLQMGLPIRGALACGELYADAQSDIFIGNALIEAYRFGEAQDWLGFALCRSATRRMAAVGLPPCQRLNYRRWKIPWSKKKKSKSGARPLYAYAIGVSSTSRGKNQHLDALREMAQRAKTRRVKQMYRNAIRFLEHFGILQPVPAGGNGRTGAGAARASRRRSAAKSPPPTPRLTASSMTSTA
jgi:hypothetical protein